MSLRSAANVMVSVCDRAVCFHRWVVLLGGVLLLWGSLGRVAVRAQAIDPGLRQQVERDVRGDNPRGKDGPLVKVGAQLALMYREHERHRRRKSGRTFRPSRYAGSVVDGSVAIDAVAARSVSTLRADLERLGLRQAATAGRLVSGYLPIRAIPDAAQLDALRGAHVAMARVHEGIVTTRGDTAIHAAAARTATNVTGEGITVGVLSDSFGADPMAATSPGEDIDSGDLPPVSRLEILQDADEGTDEGRAMMQIVHDVAPGAGLAFHTALGGQANFAQAIRNLAAAGVHVMVDDIFYLTEPMFQDGVIAQAVEEVVGDGVAYFSAAGNSNRESYAAPFRPSGETGPGGGTLHDFDPGAATDTRQRIVIPEGDSVQVSFQWTDPYASAGGSGAASDLDIYLFDGAGNRVASSIFDNNGDTQRPATDPVELFTYKNESVGTAEAQFNLVIERVDGPVPERIKYIYFPGDANPEDGESIQIDEYVTQSPTIFGHSNAAAAGTVGSVFWFATPAFEDQFRNPFAVNVFSSVGGVPIYFRESGVRLVMPAVREKPNFTGPDGVNTTFFGQPLNDDDNFPNFFGTSAAAPHVAAVAALMLEFDPVRAPLQIYDDLENTAQDMTRAFAEPGTLISIPDGFDFFSGYGFVQADAAVPMFTGIADFAASSVDGGNAIQVSWQETENAEITQYTLERQYFDGPFQPVQTFPGDGTTGTTETFEYSNGPLGLGIYTFRLRVERNDGTVVSPLRARAEVGLLSFNADVSEDEDAVELTWTVPEATSGYRYVVQRRSNGPFTTVDTTTAQSYRMDDLQPGAYDFRIVMADEAGNALSSDVLSEQIAFEGAIALGRPYPNPFVDRVHLPVTLAEDEFVTIRVYNALGQLVKLQGQQFTANVPSTLTVEPDLAWASGVYFVQIDGEDFTESRQAVLVR